MQASLPHINTPTYTSRHQGSYAENSRLDPESCSFRQRLPKGNGMIFRSKLTFSLISSVILGGSLASTSNSTSIFVSSLTSYYVSKHFVRPQLRASCGLGTVRCMTCLWLLRSLLRSGGDRQGTGEYNRVPLVVPRSKCRRPE